MFGANNLLLMNILFLTVSRITDINERGIYTDLIRKFRDEGHKIVIVTPSERRFNIQTNFSTKDGVQILYVKTLNIQKSNIIEKGISTILLEYQYNHAVKKYINNVKFDIILYSTPPITFTKVIKKIKIRDNTKTYLLLKDIFPQNAVDLGMIKKNGLLHRYFRKKEKKLYAVSDYIGCMSPANVTYLINNNPQINPAIVEVCPNSIDPKTFSKDPILKKLLFTKYGIPENSTVFIYGGNLGKPQGINFLLDILISNASNSHVFFIIVGSGTEFIRIKLWFDENRPKNALLITNLQKTEYDQLVSVCNIGLIFLDNRFTIPNFPSRLLSYLENKMPVIASTDSNSDIGIIAEQNGFGFRVLSGDLETFNKRIDYLTSNTNIIEEMGKKGYEFLMLNYLVEDSYDTIINHYK